MSRLIVTNNLSYYSKIYFVIIKMPIQPSLNLTMSRLKPKIQMFIVVKIILIIIRTILLLLWVLYQVITSIKELFLFPRFFWLTSFELKSPHTFSFKTLEYQFNVQQVTRQKIQFHSKRKLLRNQIMHHHCLIICIRNNNFRMYKIEL